MNSLVTTTRALRFTTALACCSLAWTGLSTPAAADEDSVAPVGIGPLEFERCDEGLFTIGFHGDPAQEYTIYASIDLTVWEPLGFFVEVSPGHFEYVDAGATDLASRFYLIDVNPEPPVPVVLPPSLEQLRLELGDEQFVEWLLRNKELWGNYQGLSETAIQEMAGLDPELHEQFLETERLLEDYLRSLEGAPDPPRDGDPSVGPAPYDGTREAMGDEAYLEKLRANKARWGNYQGVCGTALLEMARNYPELYEEFLENERKLAELVNAE